MTRRGAVQDYGIGNGRILFDERENEVLKRRPHDRIEDYQKASGPEGV
jgi:hypothetical protein